MAVVDDEVLDDVNGEGVMVTGSTRDEVDVLDEAAVG